MALMFSSRLAKFNDNSGSSKISKSSILAQKAWMKLVHCATNRQTLYYDELAKFLGYTRNGDEQGDPRVTFHVLGPIYHYCDQEELPPLTAIICNRAGIPGFKEFRDNSVREEVFNFDWYDVVVPTAKKLYNANKNR